MREATRVFARIGLLSFGGPSGQIALMHRLLVEEKRWIGEERFLHALNYCMLLPGPEAMQLATYVGWLLHGVKGGLVAGLLFVLPGALVLTALSAVYLVAGEVALVQGLLFGLKAAVLAVVVDALARVSRRAIRGRWAALLAIMALLGIAAFQLPFPVIVLGAAITGALAHLLSSDQGAVQDHAAGSPGLAAGRARPSGRRFIWTTAIWLAIWLVPLGLLYLWLGGAHVLAQEAAFFSVMATVTFGGAYAVLAFVAQQAVETYGWLRPDEMLTGLGLAETTPGPLILVLVFVGFLGGARLSGIEALAGGAAGALVTLWFTFVPCFLWIFAGAPYVEALRGVRWLSSALAAVTAAVVGVIANLAIWFALHVLFGELGEREFGPVRLLVPDVASFDWASALIALAAGVALTGFRANMVAVIVVAALAGAGWTLLG